MPVGAQFAAHSVTGLAITYRGNSFIGRSANNAAGKAAFGFNASTPDLVFERNIVVRGAGDTTNSTLFWTGGAGPVGTLDRNIYVAASLGLSHYCSKTFSVFKSTFSVDANSIETLTNPLDGTYAPLNPSSAYQVAPLSYPARDVDGRWRNNPACIGAREYVAPRPPRSRS